MKHAKNQPTLFPLLARSKEEPEVTTENTDSSDHGITLLEEQGRWKARNVRYVSGKWEQVRKEIPSFELIDFKLATDGFSNPHLKTVVRKPRNQIERPIPLGTVSHSYCLAQHTDVADKCIEGIKSVGIDVNLLTCNLGLTELDEWMHLRVYFPKNYNHVAKDGNALGLRLVCFNSVNASSRLVLMLEWVRFICSNGLVIKETLAHVSDIHNEHLDINPIPEIIASGLSHVEADIQHLKNWESTEFSSKALEQWVDTSLSESLGVKAACRVYHIAKTGHDVEFADPFATGSPTQKPVKVLSPVPGAVSQSRTLYDVSQAISWVLNSKNDPEDRVSHQLRIPKLIEQLKACA